MVMQLPVGLYFKLIMTILIKIDSYCNQSNSFTGDISGSDSVTKVLIYPIDGFNFQPVVLFFHLNQLIYSYS